MQTSEELNDILNADNHTELASELPSTDITRFLDLENAVMKIEKLTLRRGYTSSNSLNSDVIIKLVSNPPQWLKECSVEALCLFAKREATFEFEQLLRSLGFVGTKAQDEKLIEFLKNQNEIFFKLCGTHLIFFALQYNLGAAFRYLVIDRKLPVTALKPGVAYSTLHLASMYDGKDQNEIVKILLSKGATVNYPDLWGGNPLSLFVANVRDNYLSTLQLLLNAGMSPFLCRGRFENPLSEVVNLIRDEEQSKQKHLKAFTMLCQFGAGLIDTRYRLVDDDLTSSTIREFADRLFALTPKRTNQALNITSLFNPEQLGGKLDSSSLTVGMSSETGLDPFEFSNKFISAELVMRVYKGDGYGWIFTLKELAELLNINNEMGIKQMAMNDLICRSILMPTPSHLTGLLAPGVRELFEQYQAKRRERYVLTQFTLENTLQIPKDLSDVVLSYFEEPGLIVNVPKS